MSVSTTTTYLEYLASSGQTVFSFSGLSYLSGESSTVLKIYIDDVIASNYTIVEGTAVEGIATGGTLTFDNALTGVETVYIQRETDLTQPVIYPDSYSAETSMEEADRLLMQIQEVNADVTGGGSTSTDVHSLLPDWDTLTAYKEFEQVLYRGVAPNQQFVYRALVDHTSSDFATDLVDGKWELVYLLGVTGDAGPKGDSGDQGEKGDQGDVGPAGNDGVFIEVASQADAETGTDNAKGMSPLRTTQAIEFQVPNLPVVTGLVSDLDAAEVTVADNVNRLTAAENKITALEEADDYENYKGSQDLDNNQIAPVELIGKDIGVTGNGVPLRGDGDGTSLVRFTLQVLRQDDTETRFEQKNITIHYIEDVWYLGIEQEIVLSGSLAGVELSITTDPIDKTGQVSYISDDMTGLNYSGRIKWIGEEISIGV